MYENETYVLYKVKNQPFLPPKINSKRGLASSPTNGMSFATSTAELKRAQHEADVRTMTLSMIILDARQAMTQFEVQKAGLAGTMWTTICRAPEQKARAIFQRQLRLYSVGRFRLVAPDGKIVAEAKAALLFSDN